MPAIADITVKKNDGTTDIVYAAQVPSSGDKTDAYWRSTAHAAPYLALKPDLRLSSKWNANRDARRLDFSGAYHSYVTDSTTNQSKRIGGVILTGSFLVSQGIPQTDIDEGVSQLANLIASALIKSCVKAGFSAT